MQQDYKGEGSERRRHKRYPFQYLVDFSISLRRPGQEDFQVSAAGNISYGGALLISPYRHEIDDPVEVKLSYDGDDGQRVETIYRTEVRWIDEKAGADEKTCRIGVQYLALTEDQQKSLKYFIETYIMGPQNDGAA